MYCPHCGTQLPEESRFCSECGKSVISSQPQTPRQENPAPKIPPVTRKSRKFWKVILTLLVLIPVLTVASVFLSQLGLKSMGELFFRKDWTYANVSQFDGTYTIRKAHTDVQDQVIKVWESILAEEVRETSKDLYDRIVSSPNMDLFLMGDGENETMYLAVTPDGDMYVNYGDDNTRYFTGAEGIYYALKFHLPLGDGTFIRNCIPDGSWSSLSIGFYDADMNIYDSVFVSDPEEISQTVANLQNMIVKYGGGLYLDFPGCRALVSLIGESGKVYFLEIYDDGSADFPYRDWVYGIYNAVDVYNAIWDELCRLKGY